jgi:hypothetical protein
MNSNYELFPFFLYCMVRNYTKLLITQQIRNQISSGIICHSFWLGDKEEDYDGLLFIYYTTEQLRKLFGDLFDIIKIEIY